MRTEQEIRIRLTKILKQIWADAQWTNARRSRHTPPGVASRAALMLQARREELEWMLGKDDWRSHE